MVIILLIATLGSDSPHRHLNAAPPADRERLYPNYEQAFHNAMCQHLKAKWPGLCYRSQAGQGLVEFALALPFLMMILLGVLDLGRLYFAYVADINAAREGARYGAEYPYDLDGINAYVKEEPNTLVTVTTAISPLCTYDAGRPINDPTGTPITVTVQSNFQLLTTYVLGGGQIPLRASTTWKIFHSCEH